MRASAHSDTAGCYFLLILNGFYYNMQCSFGCHENFKIFVCIILFVYDCVFLIFYFQLFSRGFCGRGIMVIALVSLSTQRKRMKYTYRERERESE